MASTIASQPSTSKHPVGWQSKFRLPLVFLFAFFAVTVGHLTLLRLPYFWDEGGYYVPAALDFYHTGTLIPVFSNAHPPLPSVVLGSMWHLFGFHIVVTRITACAFAAAALTAVFSLGRRMLGPMSAVALMLLTAVYPIWFAQSSLAHADIFAAAFSLGALNLYLSFKSNIDQSAEDLSEKRRLGAMCLLFCLSVLAKETAIVQPAALAAYELFVWFRHGKDSRSWQQPRQMLLALLTPIPVLAAWFGYHYLKTGLVFGNPVYLRYNATANFTLSHVLYALRIRFVHLFWQRNFWFPLALAAACLLLPLLPLLPGKRHQDDLWGLPRQVTVATGVLVVANLLAFSVLGGALLTRYLLPVYPLLLLVCLGIWRAHVAHWPWLALFTGLGFVSAIWLNPASFFAPEDNLTYRDMIVVQQEAIRYLDQHFPDATVLTAWPVAADLTRPELGYTSHRFHVFSVENFTSPELAKAVQQPGRYDTALVFTTHYASLAFRRFLLTHPRSWRGRRYSADIDQTPSQLARTLGGTLVWQEDRNGEWAAVIRFNRTYDARVAIP